jgi:PKD domain
VRWGDGTTVPLKLGSHRSFHAYKRAGHYVISLLVTDRAGNVTRQVIRVTIAKPKPKRPGTGKKHATRAGSGRVRTRTTRLTVAGGTSR